ncbi:MAG: rRNA pseudouridine synthase [Candidatus Riflebacteria bacterium]|nr:rRNA pseudouridine synthase [Candidatus Riflebacteria bacterium]
MEQIRLQKLLASWGLASRRTIELWISQGRVKVDGKIVDLGQKIDPDVALIEIDGTAIAPPDYIIEEGRLVVALNKPIGVVSTLADTHDRPTVSEFLFPKERRLFPIGRLDLDATGLLLATDHGELSNRLLHPRYKVEKEYEIEISGGFLSESERQHFAGGLILDDGPTAPCRIEVIGASKYRVVLREGRKRQIKRMFEALYRRVTRLHRVRFGPIRLGGMASGECRILTPQELNALFLAAELPIPGSSASIPQNSTGHRQKARKEVD